MPALMPGSADMLTWLLLALSLCALATLTCCCATCATRCDEDWVGTSVGTDINTGSDCGWSEIAGDSEIANVVGKNLQFTTALASAKCTASAVGPSVLVFAQVVTRAGATDDARIALDFVDNDNYLAAEFHYDNGGVSTSSIIRRTAGAETVVKTRNLSATLTGGTTVNMCVYWDGTTVLFFCGPDGGNVGPIMHAVTSETVSTADVALGTGATVSSAVVFKNVNIRDFSGTAGTCKDCFMGSELLERNDSCNYFDVTFASIGGCAGLNTTFTLGIFQGDPWSSPPTLPSWAVPVSPAIGGYNYIDLDFVAGAGTDVDIIVTINNTGTGAQIKYKLATWASSHPTTGASAISGLSIPFDSQVGFSCTGAGSTCSITAVDPITA